MAVNIRNATYSNLALGSQIVDESKKSVSQYYNTFKNQAETVLTNFQAGHGCWKGGTGTMTDDTSTYIRGSQSLKLTTGGAGAVVYAELDSINPTIDMSGKFLKAWVKINNVANVAGLSVYVSNNNQTANYYWTLSDAPSLYDKSNDTWIPFCLSFGYAKTTGSPDRGAINSIKVRCWDKNSTAIAVNFGGISILAEPSAATCSITFDDGWASVFTQARLKMDQHNFPGTAYVIPDLVDTTGYMTVAQMLDLQKTGWDISAHHQTNFNNFTVSELDDVLYDVKSWLKLNGFYKGYNDIAYPGGIYSEALLPTIKKYFRSGRTIAPYVETLSPASYYKLKVFEVFSTTTTAAIATAITTAITNKEWIILVFHKIETTAVASTEYSIANFATVIDNVATQGISVKTISDVLSIL